MAVLWPSMKFADEDLIPSGAAGIGSGRERRSGEEAARQARESRRDGRQEQIKSARALVPALANDPKAREKFADLVRSALPKGAGDDEDASKAFFKRKGGDLMDRLSKPSRSRGPAVAGRRHLDRRAPRGRGRRHRQTRSAASCRARATCSTTRPTT